MVNKENLDTELFAWKQERLEQGKFPCECGHFKSAHVKGMCIACHGGEIPESGGISNYRAFHGYQQMDNLSLVEYMAKHRNDIEK